MPDRKFSVEMRPLSSLTLPNEDQYEKIHPDQPFVRGLNVETMAPLTIKPDGTILDGAARYRALKTKLVYDSLIPVIVMEES